MCHYHLRPSIFFPVHLRINLLWQQAKRGGEKKHKKEGRHIHHPCSKCSPCDRTVTLFSLFSSFGPAADNLSTLPLFNNESSSQGGAGGCLWAHTHTNASSQCTAQRWSLDRSLSKWTHTHAAMAVMKYPFCLVFVPVRLIQTHRSVCVCWSKQCINTYIYIHISICICTHIYCVYTVYISVLKSIFVLRLPWGEAVSWSLRLTPLCSWQIDLV